MHLVNEGFIKSTYHRPTDHRPTNHRPLTHRPTNYVCSFAAKLSWKKKRKKYLCFYKIYIICSKKCFYMEKKFYNEKLFLLKKTFFTEKNYISFQKYIFTQKIFLLQMKYKSFLNMYSFCKKKFF